MHGKTYCVTCHIWINAEVRTQHNELGSEDAVNVLYRDDQSTVLTKTFLFTPGRKLLQDSLELSPPVSRLLHLAGHHPLALPQLLREGPHPVVGAILLG